jgi:hypothetical protein
MTTPYNQRLFADDDLGPGDNVASATLWALLRHSVRLSAQPSVGKRPERAAV